MFTIAVVLIIVAGMAFFIMYGYSMSDNPSDNDKSVTPLWIFILSSAAALLCFVWWLFTTCIPYLFELTRLR